MGISEIRVTYISDHDHNDSETNANIRHRGESFDRHEFFADLLDYCKKGGPDDVNVLK